MQTVTILLGCVFSESQLLFPSHGSKGPQPRLLHCLHICHPSFLDTSSQQLAMSYWSGDDASVGPAVWTEQDPEFMSNFPALVKRDFKFVREVRSYVPHQPVNWQRWAHGEFCATQVYQGWNNSGRRFRHGPFAWVRQSTGLRSLILLVCM